MTEALANWHEVRGTVTTASNIAALAKLPPYELVTSASTRGLQELQARLK